MKRMMGAALATAFAMAASAGFASVGFASVGFAKETPQQPLPIPDAAQARADHCGYVSEEPLNDYMHRFTANSLNNYNQNLAYYRRIGVPPPTAESLTYGPRFGYTYGFADEAAARAWENNVTGQGTENDGLDALSALRRGAARTDQPFSLCQAMEMAKIRKTTVVVIEAGEENGLMGLIQIVPVPGL